MAKYTGYTREQATLVAEPRITDATFTAIHRGAFGVTPNTQLGQAAVRP